MRRDALGHTRLLRIDVHRRPSGHAWHPQVRTADADPRYPLRRALASRPPCRHRGVENFSIDLIFRNRRIDYFTETHDEEVVERTLNLVAADHHDFIRAYQQEYDGQYARYGTTESRGLARAGQTRAQLRSRRSSGARPVSNHVTRGFLRVRSRHARRSID